MRGKGDEREASPPDLQEPGVTRELTEADTARNARCWATRGLLSTEIATGPNRETRTAGILSQAGPVSREIQVASVIQRAERNRRG